MIQAYKEADTPPPAPKTPCQICATPGEASVGDQSLPCPSRDGVVIPNVPMTGTSSQHPAKLGTWNLQESVSPSKQADLDCLRDKSGRSCQDLSKVWLDVKEYKQQKSRVEEAGKDCSQWVQTEAPPNDHEADSRKDCRSTGAKVNTAPRAEALVMRRAPPGGAFTPRVMMPGCSGSHEWGQISWLTCP